MTKEFRQLEQVIRPAAAADRNRYHRDSLLTEKARRYLASIDTAGAVERIKGMLVVMTDEAFEQISMIFYGKNKDAILGMINRTKPESVGALFRTLTDEYGWKPLSLMTDEQIEAHLNMFEY